MTIRSRHSKAAYGDHNVVPVTGYPDWGGGLFLRYILKETRIHGSLVGVATFLGYYLLPLAIAAASGTIITVTTAHKYLASLPVLLTRTNFTQAFLNSLRIGDGLAYLNDRSHFLFAVLVSLGAAAGVGIVRNVHTTMNA